MLPIYLSLQQKLVEKLSISGEQSETRETAKAGGKAARGGRKRELLPFRVPLMQDFVRQMESLLAGYFNKNGFSWCFVINQTST